MTHYRVVLTTASNMQEARTIAKTIVEERLAACVNIISKIESFYIWQGTLQHDEEQLLIIKTAGHNVDALERRIKQLHSYEVPEFISIKIEEGSEEYLGWIDEVTRN